MTALTGTVVNGVVVLDGGQTLPDGERVEIVRRAAAADLPAVEPDPGEPTLIGLLKFAGKAEGLPADFAEQHDHYIHGTPKR